MARKVIGPTGSRRRYWFLLLCLVVAAISAVVFIPAAGADSVKAETFQLDGNIAQDTTSPVTYDWANFFNSSGAKSPALPDASRPGYTASAFVRDFKQKSNGAFDTSDGSTYTVGSKDTLDISGWSCTPANNVTDKGDIMNAYAVAYTDPTTGHKFMFFGLERNANAGDANVAFWFLAGKPTCPAAGGSFSGSHHDGDLLIVSAFTNGGSVSTIDAYEWQNGALNTTPVAHGADCRTATVTGDPTCATSNTGTLSNIPWLTENKTDGVGHTLQSGEFFEGGIDLSAPSVHLGDNCFNTFLPDTRSSQSLTATLYDFALGSLGECKTTLTTQENAPSGTSTPLSIGTGVVQSNTDSATLGVTGSSSWGGTLTWYLCGPFTTQAGASCPETLDSNGNPTGNHGVSVSSQGVSSSDSSHVYTSGQAYLTSAGWYCWHAHFDPSSTSAGAGVGPGDDDGTNECFQVTPVTPTLSTTASCSASPCVLGSTLNDYAQLSGTASEPGTGGPGGDTGLYKSIYLSTPSGLTAAGGNISWTAYGPGTGGAAQCATPITGAPTPSTKAVSGDSSGLGYGPVSYATGSSDKVGNYEFAASYPGDGVNTNAASAVTCDTTGANGEQVTVVGTATSSSAQRWLPNDRVVLGSTAGTTLNGTLIVKLYKGTFTIDSTSHVCTADSGDTLEKTFGSANNVSSSTNSFVFNTNNTDFFVGTKDDGSAGGGNGDYFWLVSYTDNSLTSPPDRCEKSTVTITDAP